MSLCFCRSLSPGVSVVVLLWVCPQAWGVESGPAAHSSVEENGGSPSATAPAWGSECVCPSGSCQLVPKAGATGRLTEDSHLSLCTHAGLGVPVGDGQVVTKEKLSLFLVLLSQLSLVPSTHARVHAAF